jgi:hypothetical protein
LGALKIFCLLALPEPVLGFSAAFGLLNDIVGFSGT